jgi:putative transposase
MDMPRTARTILDGAIYHVLNRGNDRLPIFQGASDYEEFQALVTTARAAFDVPVYAYCLMPNHWHMIVRPARGVDLGRFVGRLSQKHAQRHRSRDDTVGEGHLYQGRYHAIPIVGDEQFLTSCRYVERNPVEAGLVERAEFWRWSSLGRRVRRDGDGLLDEWPIPVPRDWIERVNERAPK